MDACLLKRHRHLRNWHGSGNDVLVSSTKIYKDRANMVTLKEYTDALEEPIAIPLRESKHAVLYEGLDIAECSGYTQHSLFQDSVMDRKSNKVIELAFMRWLSAHDIPPPDISDKSDYDNLMGAGYPIVHERRIAVVASVATRKDMHRMSIHNFGMQIPIGWLHSTCHPADYYVYCMVDPDLRWVSLIGYYEGYALLSYVARIGAVRQCLALPISWLHPMCDLSLILKNGPSSSTSIDVKVY